MKMYIDQEILTIVSPTIGTLRVYPKGSIHGEGIALFGYNEKFPGMEEDKQIDNPHEILSTLVETLWDATNE